MLKVLVTGGDGQLGRCIKDLQLQHQDLNFIYTDYLELDITKKEEVESFFSQYAKIDYCINCAAYTAVDKAETEEELAIKINSIGAKNLAEVCKRNETILIHISTDFVFDGKKNEPYNEEDMPNPISVYGASKLQGEIDIQNTLREHFIIRTSWLYSEHGNNFVKTMLWLAETRDEIRVVSDQIGTPTYARDLANVILHILTIDIKSYGLYHYSNEGVASWYDFAKAIFEESNIKTKVLPIKSENYSTAAKRPYFSLMDKTKIKTNFEIEILHWRDSLKIAMTKL